MTVRSCVRRDPICKCDYRRHNACEILEFAGHTPGTRIIDLHGYAATSRGNTFTVDQGHSFTLLLSNSRFH